MKDIGSKLRARREELGLSIEELSIKTKIQPHYLRALEEGNIEFFSDDVSYLKYFMRFYCKAIEFDFEEIRPEFDQRIAKYQDTVVLKKVEVDTHLKNLVKQRINESNASLKLEKKRIDYSLISFILVVIVIVGCVVFFSITYGPGIFESWFGGNDKPIVEVTPLPSTTPSTTPEATETPEVVSPENLPLIVTPVESNYGRFDTYELRGWSTNELVSIRVDYGVETWMQVLIDDVVTNNPASKIYQAGESMEVLQNATDDLVITLHFGKLSGNVIYINNQEYTLADDVKDITGSQRIHFILKGE